MITSDQQTEPATALKETFWKLYDILEDIQHCKESQRIISEMIQSKEIQQDVGQMIYLAGFCIQAINESFFRELID